jgi:hypothetical protein
LEQRLVQPAPGFVIYVLWRGADVTQTCGSHAAFKAFCLTAGCLSVYEQPAITERL